MECCICMYCSSDLAYLPVLGSCVRLSPEHSLAASAPSPPQGAIEMLLLLHNGKTFEHNACGAASPLCLSKTITSKFSGSSLHLQPGLQLDYGFFIGPTYHVAAIPTRCPTEQKCLLLPKCYCESFNFPHLSLCLLAELLCINLHWRVKNNLP